MSLQVLSETQRFPKLSSIRPNATFITFVMLVAGVLCIQIASMLMGSYDVPWRDVVRVLQGVQADEQMVTVVMEFRLPRALCGLFAGGLFAMSGSLLQGLTRNPLADPSIVGVSQGAALAVVIWVVAGQGGDYWREPIALAGGLTSALLIHLLTDRKKHQSSLKFILMGIGLAALLSAITSAFLTYGGLESVMTALTWLSGSLHRSQWQDVGKLMVCFVLLLPASILVSRYFPIQSLGDALAVSLGVPLKLIRRLQLFIAVTAAAIATAVVGPIGFVGLLAPHMARRLPIKGPRQHLLASLLIGASLVSLADLLGRMVVAPVQIPAGLVSTLVGAPALLMMLAKRPRQQR